MTEAIAQVDLDPNATQTKLIFEMLDLFTSLTEKIICSS